MDFWKVRPDVAGAAVRFGEGNAFVSAGHYGNGHVNDTYTAFYSRKDGSVYRIILQRINTDTFKDPAGLMRNIESVTGYLRERIKKDGGDPSRQTMTVIPDADGELCYTDKDGCVWRAYVFIEDTVTRDSIENESDFEECGRAFGSFQMLLADYPAAELSETIPRFHDTEDRFRLLEEAIGKDACGRAA